MERSDWVDICASIADLWHDSQMTAKRVGAWFPLLADLDTEDVRAAVLALAGSGSPWPPRSPGEIRAAIATDDGWEQALGDLYAAVRRHGRTDGIPDGIDPRTAAYVHSSGGWVALCLRDDGWATDPAARAQFREFWRDAADRVQRQQSVASATAVLGLPERLAIGRSVE
jgi:hypothetical protein